VQTYKRKKQKDINNRSTEKAVEAVLEGMTLRKVPDLFGVIFNTLFYHIKKQKTHRRTETFYQSIPLIKYSLQRKKICSRNTQLNTRNE
jgi:hypothetical protein